MAWMVLQPRAKDMEGLDALKIYFVFYIFKLVFQARHDMVAFSQFAQIGQSQNFIKF